MTDLTQLDAHFAFGENWRSYAGLIDDARIRQATTDLERLLGGRLDGRSLLDIGCGSGLSALAALRLGAREVVGVDIDPDSVTAADGVLGRFAPGG
ncbi:MAG TPA: 50S ribosomal protein L11 methyltransferase, partial [Gemmatimonadales bacterium]|nr:50S ribosomal protein L11 methyltransferase [Gemmatimonadales bacterium]